MHRLRIIPCLALVALLAACGTEHQHATVSAATAPDDHAGHDHGAEGSGIALPETVQRNLGITWAAAEYRVVQGVLRLPGRFEAEPTARRTYRTPIAGRVEVLVRPYQRVAAGDPLYRLESEEWQRLQLAIAEGCDDGCADGCGTTVVAARNLQAAQRRVTAVQEAHSAWSRRLEVLRRLDGEIGGKAAELAEASARLAELAVESGESQRQMQRMVREAEGPDGTAATGLAAVRRHQLFARAAAITGLSRAELEQRDAAGVPRWLAIEAPVVRAAAAGQVEGEVLAAGTWVESRSSVLTVTDPAGVRFRAAALQGDLPRLRDGLPARIAAADPAVVGSLPATMVLGPIADPVDRSLEVIARPQDGTAAQAWARPGVTAVLEVVVAGSADEELAIPVGATIRDGLTTVLFRRDPKHPDRVARIEADLGTSDGRWVVVQSGVKEGDQVVLGGIYPLKLSQQTGAAQAGHFDPDGTFHTGKH